MKYFKIFIKKHKGKVILAIFLLLGQVVGTLLIPALIANVIDHGILRGDMNVVINIGIQMLVVAIIATIIAICGSWTTSNLGSLFGFEMRTKLFRKLQQLSVDQFDNLGVSSLITRSTSDITNLQQTLGMILQMIAPAPIIAIVSMVMTYMINPQIVLIQFVFMAILVLSAIILLKKSSKLSRSIQTRLDDINKVVHESITGVRVIRAFGNENYENSRSNKAFSNYAQNMIKLNRIFAIFTPIVWMLMGGLMVIVLSLGGLFSISGKMAVGEITAVIEYATLTMGYLIMAVSSFTMLPKALACLKRLEEVLDTPASITDSRTQNIQNCSINTNVTVEFENVNFAYLGAEEPVIHNLSFSIKKGQTTAIIGSTGSGKSTLFNLMLRMHDIKSGQIRLNGVNIQDFTQHQLREKIGSVPQKSFLFSGTIADNLRMGKKDATDEEMWHALKIAQADTFVEKLPDRLLSPVLQGGTNFSGGQRQRISIARALIKKADIYLFDDSFSALDMKTDATLRHALQQHLSSVAKLIIAQRVSSIIDADQIIVLDQGRMVGMGTHTTLLKECLLYQSIVDSQMGQREV